MFNYIWGKQYMAEAFRDQERKPGRFAAFSPDSHMVAVWDDAHIAIYIYQGYGVPNELGRFDRTIA